MNYSYNIRNDLITSIFSNDYASNKRTVYRTIDMKYLLKSNEDKLVRMKMTTLSINDIIKYLLKYKHISKLNIESLDEGKKTLFITNKFRENTNLQKNLEVAQALHPNGYFSYATSLYLKGIIRTINNVTISIEQKRNYNRDHAASSLTQEQIDSAMSKSKQSPKTSYIIHKKHIQVVHCQSILNSGVLINEIRNQRLKVADLERTLIDICVRPELSGGIKAVIDAIIKVRMKNINIDISRLIEYLKLAEYIYPYHQVIGFLFDISGMDKSYTNAIKNNFTNQYDFYLHHDPKNINKDKLYYNKEWKILYSTDLIAKYLN